MIGLGKTPAYSLSIMIHHVAFNLLFVIALILLSWLIIKEFKVLKESIQDSRVVIRSNVFQLENDSEIIVETSCSELKKSEIKFIKLTLTLNLFYILLRSFDVLSVIAYRTDLLNGIAYRPSTVIIRNMLYILVPFVFSLNILIIFTFNKMFKYSLKNISVRVRPAF